MKSVRLIIFFLLFLTAAFVLLGGRCVYLQLVKHSYYAAISSKQQIRMPQKPQRGTILDSRGRVLAASNKVQTIFAEPRVIDDVESLADKLECVLKIDKEQICRFIEESKNPGYVKLKVGAEAEACRAAFKIHRGIGVESNWNRYYPMSSLAGHVVGFTSSDNRGLDGIECQYDSQLAGKSGQNVFVADMKHRPMRFKGQTLEVSDGQGVILTIDATIQQFVREELLKQYKLYEAESAVAIAAEPKSGEILALVSLPDFDPGDKAGVDVNNFRNRAISDQFEPGSILKPIIMSIALDTEVVNTEEEIFCENGNYYGRGFGRIGEYRNHGYGDMTVKDILVRSSNIGMAKIGQRVGKEKLYKGLRHFGFARKTGIDLPGEVGGFLWPVSKWTGYSVTRVPFGQEICTTAIQLMKAYCILANGGRSVKPHLVKAIVERDGRIVRQNREEGSIGYVVDPAVAKWMVTEALTGVVNEVNGTGRRAKLERWQVFGKTGTADIAKSDERGYEDDAVIASFIGGAPAAEPAIIVLVVIRRPNKALDMGYSGGKVAAPVVSKIIEKTLTYLENKNYAKF